AGSIPALLADILNEAPRLADRIAGDMPARWKAIAGIPYGWSARESRSGLFRVGDQAAVIASLVGDGVGMALTSGIAAAHALLGNGAEGAASWQRDFEKQTRRPIALGETLR